MSVLWRRHIPTPGDVVRPSPYVRWGCRGALRAISLLEQPKSVIHPFFRLQSAA